ncbi:MAG: glycosyltransferase family 87 protein [Candidatus Hodarchaeota archaeon]
MYESSKSTNELRFFQNYSMESLLLIAGSMLLLSLELFIILSKLDRSTIIFELLFFLPFIAYILSIILLKRYYIFQKQLFFPIILGFAIIYQIIILMTEISLSDDVYRFLGEGKAIINGINPYSTPISEYPKEILYFEQGNNLDLTSPYPPFALLLFASLCFISTDIFIYRLFFSICFIVSIIILYKLILVEDKWKVIIYAWNPLLHIETANGSHYDSVVLLFVMLAVFYLKTKRPTLAGISLFLAFLLKYYPIFLVVVYWRLLGKRGLIIFFSGFFLYCGFIIIYPTATDGIMTYANEWYFNASIFWVIFELLQIFELSKHIVAGIFVLILIFLFLQVRNESEFSPTAGLTIIGAFLLLQPTFHPWYIFWIFPFVLMEKRINFSWILLSGTLIFSYYVYIAFDTTQVWKESDFIRLIEFIPFYLCLLLERGEFVFSKIRNLFNTFNEDSSVS